MQSERHRLILLLVSLTVSIFLFQNCSHVGSRQSGTYTGLTAGDPEQAAPATALKVLYLPEKVEIPIGETHLLRPLVQGDELRYRWFLDRGEGDEELVSLTDGAPVLAFPEFSEKSTGKYTLEIRDRYGDIMYASILVDQMSRGQKTVSNKASEKYELEVLSVFDHLERTGSTRLIGSSINLFARVRGNGVVEFQWYRDGEKIQGAITANYYDRKLSVQESGYYSVKIKDIRGEEIEGGTYRLDIKQ